MVTDALVLKHQRIPTHNADKVLFIVLGHFHAKYYIHIEQH